MTCPNPDCPYLESRGSPAEMIGEACPYCGSVPEAEPDPGSSAPTFEIIATFREAHEAHLARGALEAEGILTEVWGEHSASLGYSDTDGTIRLGVPADRAERAREILATDLTRLIEEEPDLERHPILVPTCPTCGSASIKAAAGTGILAILEELMSGLLGRRWLCMTCGGRWRASAP